MPKPRGRQLGLPFIGTTGPHNAITDVPGVLVGYRTVDGRTEDGKFIKTGVTAVLPRGNSRVHGARRAGGPAYATGRRHGV